MRRKKYCMENINTNRLLIFLDWSKWLRTIFVGKRFFTNRKKWWGKLYTMIIHVRDHYINHFHRVNVDQNIFWCTANFKTTICSVAFAYFMWWNLFALHFVETMGGSSSHIPTNGCSAPPNLKSGFYTPLNPYHVNGAAVTFQCENLYVLSGNSKMTCKNGKWIGTMPHCTGKSYCVTMYG